MPPDRLQKGVNSPPSVPAGVKTVPNRRRLSGRPQVLPDPILWAFLRVSKATHHLCQCGRLLTDGSFASTAGCFFGFFFSLFVCLFFGCFIFVCLFVSLLPTH